MGPTKRKEWATMRQLTKKEHSAAIFTYYYFMNGKGIK